MISAKSLWGNVLLGGKRQIDAKNSNFESFESALYLKLVSMPLITTVHFTDLIFTHFITVWTLYIKSLKRVSPIMQQIVTFTNKTAWWELKGNLVMILVKDFYNLGENFDFWHKEIHWKWWEWIFLFMPC